jgi:RHS repeat-associated protein
MQMPGRKLSGGSRYGFNGKENDNEVKGEGNQQEYGMRIYDGRIGKFLSVDPITSDYPFYTPYQFAGNKPIVALDLDGLEEWMANQDFALKQKVAMVQLEQANAIANRPSFSTNNPANANWTQKWRDSKNIIAQVTYSMANGLYTFPQQLTASVRGADFVKNIGGNAYHSNGMQDEKQRTSNFVDFAATVMPSAPEFKIVKEVKLLEEGIDLTIKLKATWTEKQIAQAFEKAEALTKAETVVSKNPVQREANLRSKFKKAGGEVKSNEHVDHTIELQLGGTNNANNLKAFDASVNMSFGSQIRNQIKNVQDGTKVNRVIIQPLK